MKKFLYIREQDGGCDYTIGCGISIQAIEAASKEEAIYKIIGLGDDWKEEIREYFKTERTISSYLCETGLYDVQDHIDNRISNAYLIEVSEETPMIDILNDKLREVNDFKNELLKKSDEDSEKEQYEKLKKKFG